ncbi:MAG: UpxY family transcription antiterminator [Bacteroides sp.]
MKQWLAAYVRLYHEKKTCERLIKIGVETYLPIQEERHQWSDRVKKVERIVLPMIVFVHVEPTERGLPLTLLSVSRYLVLRGESTPAVIPDAQLERFRFMLDHSEEAVELSTAPLAPGEWIRVVKGSLKGLEGELVKVNGKHKIAVRLSLLGVAQVSIPAAYVERIAEPPKNVASKENTSSYVR